MLGGDAKSHNEISKLKNLGGLAKCKKERKKEGKKERKKGEYNIQFNLWCGRIQLRQRNKLAERDMKNYYIKFSISALNTGPFYTYKILWYRLSERDNSHTTISGTLSKTSVVDE